ncbi:MAG: amidohydrolase family protein [Eggerthellaceae bacterium]|nr:amidohydrolase family protein [Eggerthellaceae bacterium]
MAVVDCHCHIYPDKIAPHAVESVGAFYSAHMDMSDATGTGLLSACENTPITHHLVYSVATKPSQVESINDFIAAQCAAHPEFIGFATMHQDYADPEAEIERVIKLGLKGVKLHPDTQAVHMDDPRLMRLYEIIEGRLPLVVHTGDYRYDYSHPRRLKNILHTFPDLVVNAAHFGGWSIFDYAFEILDEERCFIDTSSAQEFLGPRRTYELTKLYGTDRVMFGSDFPMWSPQKEYNMLTALPFTDDEMENLLWHNVERFLGFEVEK